MKSSHRYIAIGLLFFLLATVAFVLVRPWPSAIDPITDLVEIPRPDEFRAMTYIERLSSEDRWQQASALATLRLFGTRLTVSDARAFVKWICSAYFVHERHMAITRQVTLIAGSVMEEALTQHLQTTFNLESDIHEDVHCRKNIAEALSILDARYGGTADENVGRELRLQLLVELKESRKRKSGLP